MYLLSTSRGVIYMLSSFSPVSWLSASSWPPLSGCGIAWSVCFAGSFDARFSSATTELCPFFLASCSEVRLSMERMVMSAFLRIRASTTERCPFSAAIIRAVHPFLDARLILAARTNKHSTTGPYPPLLAIISAVRPSASDSSTLAFAAIRISTAWRRFALAASINAVLPSREALSTDAFFATSRSMIPSWLCSTASVIAVRPSSSTRSSVLASERSMSRSAMSVCPCAIAWCSVVRPSAAWNEMLALASISLDTTVACPPLAASITAVMFCFATTSTEAFCCSSSSTVRSLP
mmetsp:Transcript_11835/g.28266  ORF Transcript_11835/g.28266 Transcript_11835/m.28266 type:complete len:293 (-) Transcript_11835:3687-4565(-)